MEKLILIKNYFKELYSGRIGRKHYFLGLLFFIISFYIVFFVLLVGVLKLLSPDSSYSTIYVIFFTFVLGFIFIAYGLYIFSLHIRRLHDIGHTGLWIILGPIVVLLILFKKGQEGHNRYGEVPPKDAKFFATIFNFR